MPWLEYDTTLEDYKNQYLATGGANIPEKYLKMKLEKRCGSTSSKFYVAEYALNGTLISFGEFDTRRLQLCNTVGKSGDYISPFSAASFFQKCDLSVQSLIDSYPEPTFF